MGGSILPVTIHNGKMYFLFGKERDIDENPGWSDFGGGTDKGETFLQTAVREGGEELTGFLGTDETVRKMLVKYGTYNIDYKSKGYSTYRCHIFPMEYDPMLVYYYNNNQAFLQKRLDPKIIKNVKIFEKTQIKWFSIAEMKKNYKQFRSFYKNIVDQILQNKDAIYKFVSTKNIRPNTLRTNKKNKSMNKNRYNNKFTRKR